MKTLHIAATAVVLALAVGCGPMVAPPDTTVSPQLAGENEVPAVATAAGGDATATLTGTTLVVSGSFDGLMSDLHEVAGSAAHIHVASAGANGPVLENLDVDSQDGRSGTFSGTFELDAIAVAAFHAGQLYVNVHTQQNPSGELRGQLTTATPTFAPVAHTFDARLAAENEPHGVTSPASGTAVGVLREDGTLTVSGHFADLASPLHDVGDMGPAHVHQGGFGDPGPVAFALDVVAGEGMTSGRFGASSNLEAAEIDTVDLLTGGYHVNVHTTDEPQGEIRGQLFPTHVETTATLEGGQEVPPVDTAATGTATATMDGFDLSVEGAFAGLESDPHEVAGSPAHVHVAPRGEGGPIVYVFDVESPDVATAGTLSLQVEMTEEERADFVAGRHYVNVHTADHMGGEIRGQFEPFEAVDGPAGGVIYGDR